MCFVCLQAVFWLIVPKLIREEKVKLIMTILLLIFLFQFLPKIYHCICLMRRMQKVTGYIFGTIWWGFALNLIAYFIASHVSLLKLDTQYTKTTSTSLQDTKFHVYILLVSITRYDIKVVFFNEILVVSGRWRMLVCSRNTACCFLHKTTMHENRELQSESVLQRRGLLPICVTDKHSWISMLIWKPYQCGQEAYVLRL